METHVATINSSLRDFAQIVFITARAEYTRRCRDVNRYFEGIRGLKSHGYDQLAAFAA